MARRHQSGLRLTTAHIPAAFGACGRTRQLAAAPSRSMGCGGRPSWSTHCRPHSPGGSAHSQLHSMRTKTHAEHEWCHPAPCLGFPRKARPKPRTIDSPWRTRMMTAGRLRRFRRRTASFTKAPNSPTAQCTKPRRQARARPPTAARALPLGDETHVRTRCNNPADIILRYNQHTALELLASSNSCWQCSSVELQTTTRVRCDHILSATNIQGSVRLNSSKNTLPQATCNGDRILGRRGCAAYCCCYPCASPPPHSSPWLPHPDCLGVVDCIRTCVWRTGGATETGRPATNFICSACSNDFTATAALASVCPSRRQACDCCSHGDARSCP